MADGLGDLDDRLTKLLSKFLFPEFTNPTRDTQLVSLASSFSRALVGLKPAYGPGEPVPADTTSLFAPVVTTPALSFAKIPVGQQVSAQNVAQELASYLDLWLHERKLAQLGDWAIALRLFSEIGGEESQSPLLELIDLRVRMAPE